MQKLVLLLALCLPAFATRIQDTNIRDSSGRLIMTGRISVCPPGSYVSGPWWISKDCVHVSITSAALNITLQPGTYRAHWITQYFDPDLKGSKIGGPTAEHSEANTAPLLIGDDLAR
jgi:hypothetical protein